MESLVRRVVQKSLGKLDSGRTYNLSVDTVSAPVGDDLEAPGPSQLSHSSIEASDSEAEVDDPGAGFYFALVPPLVKAVKEPLRWEEPMEAPTNQKKYFKYLKKEPTQTSPSW